MLSCKEVTELATDYLEGDLAWRERVRVRLHLWMCRHCRRYLDQMRKVIELLERLPTEPIQSELLDKLLPQLGQTRDKPA